VFDKCCGNGEFEPFTIDMVYIHLTSQGCKKNLHVPDFNEDLAMMFKEFKSVMIAAGRINPLPEKVASVDFKFKRRGGLESGGKEGKKVVRSYELRSSDASEMVDMAKRMLAMRT
jgi:hypothetical protein